MPELPEVVLNTLRKRLEECIIIITEKIADSIYVYTAGAKYAPATQPAVQKEAEQKQTGKQTHSVEECLKNDPLHGRFVNLAEVKPDECRKIVQSAIVVKLPATEKYPERYFAISKCLYGVVKALLAKGIDTPAEVHEKLTKLGFKLSEKQTKLLLSLMHAKHVESVDCDEVAKGKSYVPELPSAESAGGIAFDKLEL